MTDLKIPTFMKKREDLLKINEEHLLEDPALINGNGLVELGEDELFYDDEDEISSKITEKISMNETPANDSFNNDIRGNEALIEAEKRALRSYINGMDETQLGIILDEIPMTMIIAHFDKKWKEAETFRHNISTALGGIK